VGGATDEIAVRELVQSVPGFMRENCTRFGVNDHQQAMIDLRVSPQNGPDQVRLSTAGARDPYSAPFARAGALDGAPYGLGQGRAVALASADKTFVMQRQPIGALENRAARSIRFLDVQSAVDHREAER
jgi:hypothetical protein